MREIQILKRCEAESYCSHYKQKYNCIGCGQREALDLAIEALKEPTRDELGDCHLCRFAGSTMCGDCINGSRWARDMEKIVSIKESVEGDEESATTTDCNDCIWNTCNYNKIDWDLEVSEDCISRAKAISAVRSATVWKRSLGRGDILDILYSVPSAEQVTGKLKNPCDSLLKADSDECKEQKSKLDCISREQAIEAFCDDCRGLKPGQCEHWDKCKSQKVLRSLPPVTPTEQNEEDILKFYYVESLDEYWVGRRSDNFYYAEWRGSYFVWTHSRYLPWGEHIVDENTLWKEHTYPSEPKEIPFNEWLQGFLEKERQTEKAGEWLVYPLLDEGRWELACPECGDTFIRAVGYKPHFCENCGARMMGGDAE